MLKLFKGDVLENVDIIDIAEGGKAVGKYNQLVVFVKNAIPGDNVNIVIKKVKRRYYEGHVISFNTISPKRIEPECAHFGICGGCKWQHLDYKAQLSFKQKQVTDSISRIGRTEPEIVHDIIPSDDIYFYRNKLEFTFSNKRWLTDNEFDEGDSNQTNMNALGFHIPGMFNKVLNIEECLLQPKPSNNVRLAVRNFALSNDYSFFDIKEQQGFLRNLIIRNSLHGELMVIVVFFYRDDEKINKLLNFLNSNFNEITSLMYVVNPKHNDTISDLNVELFKGKDFLIEKMGDVSFKIGPKAFFQTNTRQAVKLYEVVKEMAQLTGNEIVYDLYTGTGSIAIYLSPYAKKIIGIEYIEQAVQNAKENTTLNKQKNTVFVSGVIEKILDDDFVNHQGLPDVIVTDPPRSGMHPKVVTQLIKTGAKRIVYVSCNPSTQARDIALLTEAYHLHSIQPVDMFPHTEHVENVALLIKK